MESQKLYQKGVDTLYTFLLATNLLISPVAFSQFTCPENIDYSHRFGPIRDQDGHGYCFAFAAAALAEEFLCKEDQNKCRKSVSPLDISRCNWTLGIKEGGGDEVDSLNCITKQTKDGGVCFEEQAPYSRLNTLGCQIYSFFMGGGEKEACNHRKLTTLFDQWKKIKEKETQEEGASCEPETKKSFLSSLRFKKASSSEAIYQKILELFPKDIQEELKEELENQPLHEFLSKKPSRTTLEAMLTQNKNSNDFLKAILIRENCKSTRNLLQDAEVKQDSIPKKTNKENLPKKQDEMLTKIKEALETGSSIAVGLKLDQLGVLNYILYPSESMHAVIIDGMRFNPKKKKCEVHLRNSWGEGADLHGWYSAEKIKKGIKTISYLKNKK